uniref:Uncharacterized protein n=1 Tax=Oryza glaberrima TaxID=4538 RepID=I1R8E0_ORYGL
NMATEMKSDHENTSYSTLPIQIRQIYLTAALKDSSYGLLRKIQSDMNKEGKEGQRPFSCRRCRSREPRDLEHPHSVRLDPWFPGLGHPDLEVLSLGLGVASTGSGGDGGSSSPAGDGGDGRLHLADGAGRRLGSRPAVRRRYGTGARHADLERIEGRPRLEGNLAAHRVAPKSGSVIASFTIYGKEFNQTKTEFT